MEQLEQRCVHRHTLHRHTHTRSMHPSPKTGPMRNCLKDASVSTWVNPQPKVPPSSGFQLAFPPEGIERLPSLAFFPSFSLCVTRLDVLLWVLTEDSGTNPWSPSRNWARGSWSWWSLIVTRCRNFPPAPAGALSHLVEPWEQGESPQCCGLLRACSFVSKNNI